MQAIYPAARESALKETFLGKQPGYFVEVGANDPVEGSQTWHLEALGWTGVLIEPLPLLAEQLRSARKARVVECACSSPENAGSTREFFVAGALSSFDPNLMEARATAQGSITVSVKTLDQVLDEANAPTPIDFLSIDVEGHEVDVLKGFDLGRWRPRLLLLEDHLLSLDKHRFIAASGYKLFRRTALNNWYVPQTSPHEPSLFGRLQLFRKMYLGLPIRRLHDFRRRRRRAHAATSV